MKKFSTASLRSILPVPLCFAAWLPWQVLASSTCEWAPTAPEQHQVQRGDTLWDLASIFLKNPWCWPSVWELNQTQIRNPHWIYPGQIIRLDRARGVLRLANDNEVDARFLHLSPRLRTEAAESKAIPLISRQLLMQLKHAPLLNSGELSGAPVVAGLPEARSLGGEGDSIVVRGDPGPAVQFDIVRPALPIADPDTGELLGVANLRIGQASVLSRGQLSHRFLVTASRRELKLGDRLMKAATPDMAAVSPHPSTAPAGKLAAILNDGRWAALHDVVAINRGSADGLDPGSVVKVVRQVRILNHDYQPSHHAPEEGQPIAILLVFEVAERVSLAVVMRSRDAITIGDSVLPPETLPQ